jgi:hypothetical protein
MEDDPYAGGSWINHKRVGSFRFPPNAFHQSEARILVTRGRTEGVKKKAVLLSGPEINLPYFVPNPLRGVASKG